MSFEWQKHQYEIKMAALEAKYKKFAEIWHHKGRKAFSDAISKQELPNWNDFFEEEWAKFVIIKLKCPKCENIKEFKVNFEKDEINVFEEFNGYVALICISCGDMIEIDRWKVIT
jgi:hypothetical protein